MKKTSIPDFSKACDMQSGIHFQSLSVQSVIYIYQAQLSEDLLLNEKAWNDIGNQKKDHISPGY